MNRSIGTGIAAASTKPKAAHTPEAQRLEDRQQPDLVFKKEMEDFLQDRPVSSWYQGGFTPWFSCLGSYSLKQGQSVRNERENRFERGLGAARAARQIHN